MKQITTIWKTLGALAIVGALLPLSGLAQPVPLGTAGNFSLVEMGPGAFNVSIAQGGNVGFINGDIAIAPQGSLNISAGNFPMSGTVYAWQLAGINTGGNAPVVVNLALVQQAAADAFNASTLATAMGRSGGGLAYAAGTALSVAGGATLNLTPGVYNLSSLNLGNGAVINLAAGGTYLFNISGNMVLDHAQILNAAGLNVNDILFNLHGNASTSGGLNNESIINGTVLVPFGSISLTPGLVNGRILAGGNINIASGGSVNGPPPPPPPPVPDSGSTLALTGIGLGLLAMLKRKLLV